MPDFGRKSTEIRATINPVLGLLCDGVVKYHDISLIRGRCGKAEQNRLFDLGLSKLQWPHSNHNANEYSPFPDNLAMAVDAVPFPVPKGWGELRSKTTMARDIEWKERVKFYMMVAVFKYEWAQLQNKYKALREYKLRCGADWDGDNDFNDQNFDDLCHFEIVKI